MREPSCDSSDKSFRDNVNEFFRITGCSNADFADRMGTSVPTIERWRSGRNAPHPAMRKHVYEAMRSRGE